MLPRRSDTSSPTYLPYLSLCVVTVRLSHIMVSASIRLASMWYSLPRSGELILAKRMCTVMFTLKPKSMVPTKVSPSITRVGTILYWYILCFLLCRLGRGTGLARLGTRLATGGHVGPGPWPPPSVGRRRR
jgi:hypothetical protein